MSESQDAQSLVTPCADASLVFAIDTGATGVKSAIPLRWILVPSLSKLSSTDLVRRCAGSRDSEVWVEFIRRFQPVIASAVLRTARLWGEPPRHLLDDLVQDTYLRLCQDESQMLRLFHPQHQDSIYGFIKRVASNVVHDHFKSERANKRDSSKTDALDDLVQTNATGPGTDLEEDVLRKLQRQQVESILIKELSGKDAGRNRTIFWLRHIQGFTASEIAAIPAFGLTTEGVESVLLRLMNVIRSHVQNRESA